MVLHALFPVSFDVTNRRSHKKIFGIVSKLKDRADSFSSAVSPVVSSGKTNNKTTTTTTKTK